MPVTSSQVESLQSADLTPGARRLLLWLLSQSDSRGIVIALPRDILAEVSLSPDGLATLLDELVTADLVTELPACKIAQCQYRVMRLIIGE